MVLPLLNVNESAGVPFTVKSLACTVTASMGSLTLITKVVGAVNTQPPQPALLTEQETDVCVGVLRRMTSIEERILLGDPADCHLPIHPCMQVLMGHRDELAPFAERNALKRFVVHVDELLTAFRQPEAAIRAPTIRLGTIPEYKGIMHIESQFILTIAALAIASGLPSKVSADELKEAKVTQVIQDVRVLPSNASPRPAAVNDDVRQGTAVRTGVQSRSELTFKDQTMIRLGEKAVFNVGEGARAIDLGSGQFLLYVPKKAGGAKVKTGPVTAAITGASLAVAVACRKLAEEKKIDLPPIRKLVAAVSAGVLNGEAVLDLNYEEDKGVTVDFNLVATEDGEFVELQGSGEEATFSGGQLSEMLILGKKGIAELIAAQRAVLARLMVGSS